MSPFTLITLLSVLTVFGQVLSAVLIAALLTGTLRHLTGWISRNAVTLMSVVAITATAGSLFFSDIAGWTPCKLCWYQRIFMYPQVPILLLALWKRDRSIAPYILTLCAIGAVIAAVHYGEQVNLALHPSMEVVPCDDTGVSCARTPTFAFGYITIPLMALTAFAMNAAGSLCMLQKRAS
jgi:disulfide bond formation protein DsbB